MSEQETEFEDVPVVGEEHPDHEGLVDIPEDVEDNSEPVEFSEDELNDLDLDDIDVNVPVLTGDDANG